MKKIVSVFMIAVLFVTCMAFAVNASITATVDKPSIEAYRGDTLVYTLAISNNVVIKSGYFEINIPYDDTNNTYKLNLIGGKVVVENINAGDFDDPAPPLKSVDKENATATFAFENAVTISKKLLMLQFVVPQDASFGKDQLSISIRLVEEDGNEITATAIADINIVCPHSNTTEKEAVDPTCQNSGYTAGVYCTDCETYIIGHEEVVNKDAHKWADTWEKGDETNHTRKCTVDGCNAVDTGAHGGTWTVDDKATCQKSGTEIKTCPVCDREFERTYTDKDAHVWATKYAPIKDTDQHAIFCTVDGCEEYKDATSHTWNKGETEAPSCDEAGTQHYSCVCDATKSETLDATKDHKYGDWYDNKNGVHTRECTTCTDGTPEKETQEHNWDDGVVTTKPTCHTKGEKTYTCKVETCGATKTEPIDEDATMHKWVFKMDSNGKDGKHIEYCEVDGCAAEKAAVAHTWDVGEVTTDPGCNTTGVKTYTCTATGCGATYTEEVKATGNHVYGAWVNDGVNADGTGTHTHTCTTCDETGAVAKETVNHTWNAGEVTTKPGCNTTGVKTYTCTATGCGATYTEEVAATGNHVYDAWVSDGVTAEGEGTHTHTCTTCDSSGAVATETVAHDWNRENGVVKVEPTCCKMGQTEYTCKDCKATYIATDIPATNEHNWKYTMVSDGKDGQHTAECSNDGCKAKLDAAAHVWDEGTITKKPSCVDGVKTFACIADGCGATYTEAVPATGEHVWGDGKYLDETNHVLTCIGCETTTQNEAHYYVDEWKPLDGDTAKHVRYCASCGDERTAETEDHVFGDDWTYDEDGIATRACVCGAIETCDHTDKWNEGVITTEPKCEKTGVKTYTCSHCAGTKTEEVPELGHDFEKSEWKKVDDKYHERSCANKDCGEVERAEHGWTEGEKEQQYVCHDGVQHYNCPDCNGIKTEKIPAIDHDYKVCEKVDEKTHKHICDVCKNEKVENHDWDEGEIKRPAGTNGKDDPGEALYTCEDCGATELRDLHTHEFTWKSNDEKHWKECKCGDKEEGTEAIHDLDEGVIVSHATHTKEGLSSHKCTTCGVTVERTISKTSDHNYGAWRPYGPNEHISSCACGSIKTASHSFGAWTVTKAATSEAEGVESRSCGGCGYAETRSIAKLPVETTTETTTEETTTAETTTETTAEETTTAETTTEITTAETTTAETTTVVGTTTTETTTAETTTIGDEKHEIEVEKSVWKPGKKNSDEGMSFRSYADFVDFVGVRVDGVEISRDFYDVREGSTIVVLKAEYLEELSTGMHTIDIVSVTGVASASFEVAESGNNGWIAPVCIAIVAVGVIAGAVFFIRKKKNA